MRACNFLMGGEQVTCDACSKQFRRIVRGWERAAAARTEVLELFARAHMVPRYWTSWEWLS